MSGVVYDMAATRREFESCEPLVHTSGVKLPFEKPSDAILIAPEIRNMIRSGAYCADVVQLLPKLVRPGDRVLVIGPGLGVISTLAACCKGVERVIAVEPNVAMAAYVQRTHALNGVREVETLNAVLELGKCGRAPVFSRRDNRTSSLLPSDGPWQQLMAVPFMDLNLILTEERISLVISTVPMSLASPLTKATLSSVGRILFDLGPSRMAAIDRDRGRGSEPDLWPEPVNDDVFDADLLARGFVRTAGEPGQSCILFQHNAAAARLATDGLHSALASSRRTPPGAAPAAPPADAPSSPDNTKHH